MRLAVVPPENLGLVWQKVEPLLKPAIDQSGGRYTVDSTRSAITKRDMQLWIAFTEDGDILAAMTSCITVYPSLTMLAVVHCGGRMMGLWLHSMSQVETWAKEQGCEGVEIAGRAGWEKALPGYAKAGTLIERKFR